MKAIVKIKNEDGKYLLQEIRGLKEGTIIDGVYNPTNKSISFVFNGYDSVLYVGYNCELLPTKKQKKTNKKSKTKTTHRGNKPN